VPSDDSAVLDEDQADFLDGIVPLRIISCAIPQTKTSYMSIRYMPVFGCNQPRASAIEHLIVALSIYGRAARHAGPE
jgi:hypothetical protein